LTDEGQKRLSDSHHPEHLWGQSWNGIWYLLVYDVPESRKSYREALRGFLKRLRLGQLQRSVWVTPRDIRPDYADLTSTSDVTDISFLLESRTVLGRKSHDVVSHAWDFEGLGALQDFYCATCEQNLARLGYADLAPEPLVRLARDEMKAYLSVMAGDPLLPMELWPHGYLGQRVLELHRQMMREIGERLSR
jgi:phenylacetic acid degradation operon negative regulatory protein